MNVDVSAYTVGAAAILDYCRIIDRVDVRLRGRYTFAHNRTIDSSDAGLEGEVNSQTANLGADLRVPTGVDLFRQPLKILAVFGSTSFLGENRDALGFSHFFEFGGGLELDVSQTHGQPFRALRVRLSRIFGDNVEGFQIGFGVGF